MSYITVLCVQDIPILTLYHSYIPIRIFTFSCNVLCNVLSRLMITSFSRCTRNIVWLCTRLEENLNTWKIGAMVRFVFSKDEEEKDDFIPRVIFSYTLLHAVTF